jgi:hypothetical protein
MQYHTEDWSVINSGKYISPAGFHHQQRSSWALVHEKRCVWPAAGVAVVIVIVFAQIFRYEQLTTKSDTSCILSGPATGWGKGGHAIAFTHRVC